MTDHADINDYLPLCDVTGCNAYQCGENFEGYVDMKFKTLQKVGVRIRPCKLHLSELKKVAYKQ